VHPFDAEACPGIPRHDVLGAVPLSRETGSSPWEEGRDTQGVLRDSRYGL
jgi:hypothetical protein